MHITLSPVRADASLTLSRAGDVLVIDGVSFDLSPLAEGARLPQSAMACPWLAGDITRSGCRLHLSLLLPHGQDAGAGALFPAALDNPPDGPVTLPGQADQTPEPGPDAMPAVAAPRPDPVPGAIDWEAVITAEAEAEATLEAARLAAEASLTALLTRVAEAITGRPPIAEMLSWAAKEQAARAVLADTRDPEITGLVTTEADVTNEDPGVLARKILANAATYRTAVATLTGVRRIAAREIARAATTDEVNFALAAAVRALEQLHERA